MFECIGQLDYEGLIRAAVDGGIDLEPIYQALESRTVERLNGGLLPRAFEYTVLEMLFSESGGEKEGTRPVNLVQPLAENKIRELFRVLGAPRFEENQKARLKYYLEAWNLQGLRAFLWEKGLTEYFNERFSKLHALPETRLTLEEILEKSGPAEILDEKMLVENFVFDQASGLKYEEGLKESLYQQQQSEETAADLLQKLYGTFESKPLNYENIRKGMLELHMEHVVEQIERRGMTILYRYIKENWLLGAREIALRHNFALPGELETQAPEAALQSVKLALLSQAETGGESIRKFLRWEAILSHSQPVHSGHCYVLGGGYLLMAVSPVEEREHYLFGQYLTDKEKGAFLRDFFMHYFSSKNLRACAARLSGQYMRELSGNIRVKNALRIAMFALPVVLIVSAIVAWLFKLTQENAGGGLLIGMALTLLGEAIAARNGYAMQVKPESHEKIPGYAIREEGVLKYMEWGAETSPPGR
ncbi:MAG: hypothetical protein A3F83_09385 [Candidatus Glassbacteria bacterium RIFCSPLOWO2_12_FULL_58_11]|uniref:Uncharacterized protein n=1 Tax=Candidatus Glassbacteria bacterium RIFCSPLOWO2_12_FULL_58_11 TaxID=1817867 RepID=A0A1F5YTG8_9BACT|nr:MAG: hypothetical protein A3F83_09385 [Candidatus Glassbacteria bacterium RIFCSPLOWO2_12_FULL_58_11]